ncbi:carbohydrate ABC transporter permease [Brachybacterium sacelli]|uniref:Multiple sugar transport system permease protein n=1 Tax=Brachybacterium sacelli TaxID=173364 RepID=A0ABS4WYF8_9MICO|nr:sugar ABC transporter permease [Brachybacterium sacelli]MBP2381244.1 multiple sugar transport system permease protein [Brachybacterium sacelli]
MAQAAPRTRAPRSAPGARGDRLAAVVMLAPNILGFSLFLGVPILASLVLSLFDADGFGSYDFVGLSNYGRMLSDPLFGQSLLVTCLYVLGMVPGVFVASLALALLMNSRLPMRGLLRAAFFLPHVVSLVVIGLVWRFLLVDKVGIVHQVLAPLGLSGISWLGDTRFALLTVLVVSIWFYMGYYMIIFLAGLGDIPTEYYDAATMDGASAIARFRHITWPQLRPTSFFVLVVSTVAAVSGAQAFDLIYVMTQGGPANATSLGMFYIYQQAFQFNNYGYASAMSATVVAFLVVVTGALFALTRAGRFDDA